VTGYSGDAGDAMTTTLWSAWKSDGMMFSTPDSDNDARVGDTCAGISGWWFRYCSACCVNYDTDGIWTTGIAVFNVQAMAVWMVQHKPSQLRPRWYLDDGQPSVAYNVQASRMLVKLN